MNPHGLTFVFAFYTLATLAYLGGFIFSRPVFQRVGLRLVMAGIFVHSIILFRFLDSPWAALHLFFMFLAFAVLLTSVVTGLIFFLQEVQIKSRRLSALFARLPALEVIDRIHARALGVGFILLTLGILSGSAWSLQVTGHFFEGDVKQWWALASWGLYLIFLNFRFAAGWRGRRGVLLSLLGFAALVFTFLGVNHKGMTP